MTEWSLWWDCITEDCRKELLAYQRQHYRKELVLPERKGEIESIPEIAQLIQEPSQFEKAGHGI